MIRILNREGALFCSCVLMSHMFCDLKCEMS